MGTFKLALAAIIFGLTSIAVAASPTAHVEKTLLQNDIKISRTQIQKEAFVPRYENLLFSHSADYSANLKNAQGNCRAFLKTVKDLEVDSVISLTRSWMFYQGKDFSISEYYRARFLLTSFFLRRLTQIYANHFEGGGDFDSRPVSCQFSNQNQILETMMARDQALHQHAATYFESNLINPLETDFAKLESLRKTLDHRHTAGKVILTAGQLMLGAAAYQSVSAWVAQKIATAWLRTAVATAIVSGATSAYFLISPVSEVSFEDLDLRDPQSLWDKTMTHIKMSLDKDPHPEVISAFITYQQSRKNKL